MPEIGSRSNAAARTRRAIATLALSAVALAATLALAQPAAAVNFVVTSNGATWQIHDAAAPGLDTGSIRTASNSQAQGFGNIIVRVASEPEPRLNGEMMRGFGLRFDGLDRFRTTRAVDLGGVSVTRALRIDRSANWARFLDTFTNTTGAPIDVDVSFGGALGYNQGNNQSSVVATSSGDDVLAPDDSWSVVAYPSEDVRPVGVAIGTPDPFPGLLGMGNHELDPFSTPLPATGHAANFHGYLNELTLAPGESRSLLRFVLIGDQGEGSAAAAESEIAALAADPAIADLSTAEVCTLANWDPAELPGFDDADCASVAPLDVPPAPPASEATTSSPYDVTGKSLAELQADMEAGEATSEEITQAYLDRIAAYDVGQLGFHAFIHVADDAIAQAKAADEARADGATGELLGIPVAIKDLFDTKDMPSTSGTLALEGWQPGTDAHQVELLREAGAVLIGKANMSEFANSGGYSESGWGQVWNGLYPSKTSFGSSGGSAVAVATSMAAGAMGSQTGVSLYAPAVGASLTTFRGTDGMASTRGVTPLTWAQDYAGPIARTVTDLAYMLNVTTGTDPGDLLLTSEADEHRPDDWTDHLDPDALEGKRIGYIPDSFESSYASEDGTGAAVMDHFGDLEAAGAELVEITDPPPAGSCSGCGSTNREGWARYIELHDDFPYADGNELLASPRVLPYRRLSSVPTTPRMTPEAVDQWLELRQARKESIDGWMDDHDVDAVVYPGFISDMYSNDTSANQHSSDRGSGVVTSTYGVPTVVVPVGTNPNGYSIAMQIAGRAWDDAEVLGMGYALEQQAQGRQQTEFAPPLEYVPGLTPPPVEVEVPGDPVTEPMRFRIATQARIRGRRARIGFRNDGPTSLRGTLALRAKLGGSKLKLGRTGVNVGPGAARKLSVKMKPATARRLERKLDGRRRVQVIARYDLRSPATGATEAGVRRAALR